MMFNQIKLVLPRLSSNLFLIYATYTEIFTKALNKEYYI